MGSYLLYEWDGLETKPSRFLYLVGVFGRVYGYVRMALSRVVAPSLLGQEIIEYDNYIPADQPPFRNARTSKSMCCDFKNGAWEG